jgi:outer membrane biosynthesis protein TonB
MEDRFRSLQADIDALRRESAATQNQLLRMEADLGVISHPAPSSPPPAVPRADWPARFGALLAVIIAVSFFVLVGQMSPTGSPTVPISAERPPTMSPSRPNGEPVQPQAPAPKVEPAPLPEPPEVPKVRPEPARTTASAARPEPGPAPDNQRPAELPESGVPGTLVVHGGDAWLEGPGGRFGPGRVPVGSYNLGARTGDSGPISLGSIQVVSGATVIVRCGFGSCRLER